MPKQVDPEYDPMIREELPTSVPENDGGKQLTQRELGRLKNKKALLAKIQQKQSTPQTSEADKIDSEAEERESKKKKSEESGDVSMKNVDDL